MTVESSSSLLWSCWWYCRSCCCCLVNCCGQSLLIILTWVSRGNKNFKRAIRSCREPVKDWLLWTANGGEEEGKEEEEFVMVVMARTPLMSSSLGYSCVANHPTAEAGSVIPETDSCCCDCCCCLFKLIIKSSSCVSSSGSWERCEKRRHNSSSEAACNFLTCLIAANCNDDEDRGRINRLLLLLLWEEGSSRVIRVVSSAGIIVLLVLLVLFCCWDWLWDAAVAVSGSTEGSFLLDMIIGRKQTTVAWCIRKVIAYTRKNTLISKKPHYIAGWSWSWPNLCDDRERSEKRRCDSWSVTQRCHAFSLAADVSRCHARSPYRHRHLLFVTPPPSF